MTRGVTLLIYMTMGISLRFCYWKMYPPCSTKLKKANLAHNALKGLVKYTLWLPIPNSQFHPANCKIQLEPTSKIVYLILESLGLAFTEPRSRHTQYLQLRHICFLVCLKAFLAKRNNQTLRGLGCWPLNWQSYWLLHQVHFSAMHKWLVK